MDITIERYTGSHRDLAWSFREADDSPELLDSYIDLGRLWVARAAGARWSATSTWCHVRGRLGGHQHRRRRVAARSGRGPGPARAGRRGGRRRRRTTVDPCDRSRRHRQPALLPALRLPDDPRRAGRVRTRRTATRRGLRSTAYRCSTRCGSSGCSEPERKKSHLGAQEDALRHARSHTSARKNTHFSTQEPTSAVGSGAVPGVPERGVRPAGGDQLVVRAELGDAARPRPPRPGPRRARRTAGARSRSPSGPSSTAASDRSRCRAARGSISEVASSSTSVCGSASTSRASATCWAWAARERAAAGADHRVEARRAARRTQSSASTAASAPRISVVAGAGLRGQREVLAQRARRRRGAPGSPARRGRAGRPAAARSGPTPPTVTEPVRGGWMPASSRPSVDLPAPDGPTIAIRSPTPTDRSMPCRTSRPSTYENRTSSASSFSPTGSRAADLRSSGTCATPSSRASDAAPTWSSSRIDDDPVDRVDEHLHVERRRGDVARAPTWPWV